MEEEPETDSGPKWDQHHSEYECADGARVSLPQRLAARRGTQTRTPRNGLVSPPRGPERPQSALLVSGTELSRDMGTVTRGAEHLRTLALPRSARRLAETALQDAKNLRSVAANEGLEALQLQRNSRAYLYGERQLDALPSPFKDSGVAEVRLPGSLGYLRGGLFRDLGTLRRLRLAEGIEMIGSECFRGCGLEELAIPANVRYLGEDAFRDSALRRLSFNTESRLEVLGRGCFGGCALAEFEAPAALRELGPRAFAGCRALRRGRLNEGLLEVWDSCFEGSGVEDLLVPASVERVGGGAFRGC